MEVEKARDKTARSKEREREGGRRKQCSSRDVAGRERGRKEKPKETDIRTGRGIGPCIGATKTNDDCDKHFGAFSSNSDETIPAKRERSISLSRKDRPTKLLRSECRTDRDRYTHSVPVSENSAMKKPSYTAFAEKIVPRHSLRRKPTRVGKFRSIRALRASFAAATKLHQATGPLIIYNEREEGGGES